MIDKKERKILEKIGFKFVKQNKDTSSVVSSLFIYVSDTRKKHESGYPFIRIFGEVSNKELIDLGWHDHYLSYMPINVDAYAKNLFHIFPWGNEKFKLSGLCWTSSFIIDKNGTLW
jgi:hypothetical protein